MTQKLILTFLILINLISCKTNPKETLITGTVIGELPAEIIYTNPINGICDFYFSQSVETDSSGNFSIILNIDTPVFVKLIAQNNTGYQESEPIIIAESGKKYELIIDLNKKEHPYFFKGEQENLQNFYNSLSRIPPNSCLYSFDKDISDMTGLRADIIKQKQKEISAITKFYEDGEITEQVYNLIKADREIYYGNALTMLASLNNRHFMSEKAEVPKLVFDIWEEAISYIPTNKKDILRITNIYDYLYNKFWYHIYSKIKYENFEETRSEFRSDGKEHTYTLSIANELYANEILEFFTAQYIILNSTRIRKNEGDKEFLGIIEKFKENYPSSVYIESLESAKERF